MPFEKDPLALRALAHPLRLRIRELLNREGALTGTEIGRSLGVSQALASHHVRQLAKYGFVRPAESGDQREHRWELVSGSLSVDTSEPGDDLDAVELAYAQRAVSRLGEWHVLRRDPDSGLDDRWLEAAGVSDSLLYLTPEEADALRATLNAAVAEFLPRGADAGRRPDGARAVALFAMLTPLHPTESGN